MKKLFLSLILLFILAGTRLYAQDTLPRFTVTNAGNNRIIIGWTNTFENIRQISIQRSFDSLSGFKTILTVPDPTTPQNGYVDTKAAHERMFYRLYIQLDKGVFMFSKSSRPQIDTTRKNVSAESIYYNASGYNDKLSRMNGNDSISIPNFGLNNGKTKPDVFRPSLHVYTYRDGAVRVNLPDDEEKKYSLKFYEEDDTFLFELKDIKQRSFKLDKSNFLHAGWFKFELFEDDRLIEKHRFYLQKDF